MHSLIAIFCPLLPVVFSFSIFHCRFSILLPTGGRCHFRAVGYVGCVGFEGVEEVEGVEAVEALEGFEVAEGCEGAEGGYGSWRLKNSCPTTAARDRAR